MLRRLNLGVCKSKTRHIFNWDWYLSTDEASKNGTWHNLSHKHIMHISRVKEETLFELNKDEEGGVSNIQIGFKVIKEGITSIHYIPKGTTFLDLSWNPIKVVRGLPETLRRLDMDHCNITQITEDIIPNGVETLFMYWNYFSKIENIPSTVKYLYLGNKYITKLEGLPEGLLKFRFDSHGTIHKLENLPQSLLELDIPRQKITKIENLPPNLKNLSLHGNEIRILEMVPDSVEYLDITNNPLEQINHIPLNCTELAIDVRCALNHEQIQYLRTHPEARRELIRQLKSGTGHYIK